MKRGIEAAFRALIPVMTAVAIGVPASGQTFDLRGSLRTWARGFITTPREMDLLETRLKLELVSTAGESGAFFARGYAVSEGQSRGDAAHGNRVDLDLQEAYFDYYTDWLTVRVGRQLITWGKADEINPTDVLNPQNLSNIQEEKLIRKTGIFAFKTNWLFADFDLEAVWKPEFKPMLLPEPGSRWFPFVLPGGITDLPPFTLPGKGFEDTEWALRLLRTFGMFDFSLTHFNGWDHIFTPVLTGPACWEGLSPAASAPSECGGKLPTSGPKMPMASNQTSGIPTCRWSLAPTTHSPQACVSMSSTSGSF
jgi:hypothetical protein